MGVWSVPGGVGGDLPPDWFSPTFSLSVWGDLSSALLASPSHNASRCQSATGKFDRDKREYVRFDLPAAI